jgi:hypothetical protein
MKSDSLFQGQVFMGILSFKTGIEFKKKKLTDIRFFWFFLDWETVLFNGFGFLINVC